ncbi:MAG TPA: DUF1801 domain-containing protein [Chitinophagaceae bacterium]|jgi:hypothetical protein|nr:DUF1801 domain-containing protein [Chitinophagaceae bacterium]
MPAAKNKTIETSGSVPAFIKKIPGADRQKDAKIIIDIMQGQSGLEPKMWGTAIIGFGTHHYKYESGREGDAPLIGFSPRKTEFVLYLPSEFDKREELLKKFGKHKTGKACIYFKKITDIDVEVMKKMVSNSLKKKLKKTDGC